ncbi:hypothetical protein MMC21_003755 [Puttea exsequens]|nr:hypothetical protein [Puttea exsequens]
MADDLQQRDLAASSATFPTDSENYESSQNDLSPSPPSSSRSPIILYSPLTIWGLIRGAAINLLLPFVNGLMLGFGELLAHEAAFRLGWSGTKVFPSSRSMGPGIEIRDDPGERRRQDFELDDMTALE